MPQVNALAMESLTCAGSDLNAINGNRSMCWKARAAVGLIWMSMLFEVKRRTKPPRIRRADSPHNTRRSWLRQRPFCGFQLISPDAAVSCAYLAPCTNTWSKTRHVHVYNMYIWVKAAIIRNDQRHLNHGTESDHDRHHPCARAVSRSSVIRASTPRWFSMKHDSVLR